MRWPWQRRSRETEQGTPTEEDRTGEALRRLEVVVEQLETVSQRIEEELFSSDRPKRWND